MDRCVTCHHSIDDHDLEPEIIGRCLVPECDCDGYIEKDEDEALEDDEVPDGLRWKKG